MSADYLPNATTPHEPRLRHGTLLAVLAAGGAMVLTVSLLFLPATDGSTPIWPALGLLGVALLLSTVVLGLSAGHGQTPKTRIDRMATLSGVVAVFAVVGM